MSCRAAERAGAELEDRARAVLIARQESELATSFAEALAISHEATAARIFLISNEFDDRYKADRDKPKIDGYPILFSAPLPDDQASELVRKVSNRSTYLAPGEAWTCMFEPHHVVQLDSPRGQLTLVICLKCSEVKFVFGNRSAGIHDMNPDGTAAIGAVLEGVLRGLDSGSGRTASAPRSSTSP
jgi:hypothetical protein